MTPTFTIIIPTIGRPTLERSLMSTLDAREGDQVIVVADSSGMSAEHYGTVKRSVEKFVYCRLDAYDSGYHWYGVEQINHVLRTVPIPTSHIMVLGDDDVYVQGALDTLREVCAEDPLVPVLYRFLAPWREVLWDVPRMQMSRISGCCIAAPTQFVGPFPTRKYVEHDYDWIVDILAKAAAAGKDPLWLDYVGVIARPEPANWKPASRLGLDK